MKRLLLVGVGLLAWCGLAEGRRIVDLTGSDWTADGAPVTVPHTWNVEDSCDGRSDGILPSHLPGWVQGDSIGMNGYARKCVTYSRDLPAPKAGRRYFLAFDGVSQKAAVRVNGRLVGRHLGAFTPFVFEITPYLKRQDSSGVRRIRSSTR